MASGTSPRRPRLHAAPKPAPWNASQKLTVLNRPVAARAMRSATSLASEPPVVNRTLPRSPGAIPAKRLGQFDRHLIGETAGREAQGIKLLSLIAATTRGWP